MRVLRRAIYEGNYREDKESWLYENDGLKISFNLRGGLYVNYHNHTYYSIVKRGNGYEVEGAFENFSFRDKWNKANNEIEISIANYRIRIIWRTLAPEYIQVVKSDEYGDKALFIRDDRFYEEEGDEDKE